MSNNIEGEDDFDFDQITDHYFKDGIIILKTDYTNDLGTHEREIPFMILKKDHPVEVAKYIKSHVVESTRRGQFSMWANNVLQCQSQRIRHMSAIGTTALTSSQMMKLSITSRMSRNTRNKNNTNETFGFTIPKNTASSLRLDKDNKNKLWADTIAKEMNALMR